MWKNVSNCKRCTVSPTQSITPNLSNIQASEVGAGHFLQNLFRRRCHCLTRKQESNSFFISHKPNTVIDNYCFAEEKEQLIPAELSGHRGLREVVSCRNSIAPSPAGTRDWSLLRSEQDHSHSQLVSRILPPGDQLSVVKRQSIHSEYRNPGDFSFQAPYTEYL